MIAEDQENNSVKIPLMYNISALDASAELKLFVPKPQKEEPESLGASRGSPSAEAPEDQGSSTVSHVKAT